MNYFTQMYLVFLVAFFAACSSKQNLNLNEIKTISLNNNIIIAGVQASNPSPVSLGIGLGGMASSHVGIGVSTIFNPTISNNQDLKLQDSFFRNNISLAHLIENEFNSQMRNDELFKDKFVNFGSQYTIYLFIPKYSLEKQFFSSKTQVKLDIEMKILDSNNKVIYENKKDNILFSHNYNFSEDEIFFSKENLLQVSNLAIKQVITRLILEMKKDSKL